MALSSPRTRPLAGDILAKARTIVDAEDTTGRATSEFPRWSQLIEANTGVKSLCWGFELQNLTWPFVGRLTADYFPGSALDHAEWR
jgi:hypothetical protein